MTVRGGGVPAQTMALCRGKEWVRRLGASPPMRMTASWLGSLDPPNTRLWRDLYARPNAGSPLIVIPTTSSVPPCSELSRYGLASAERVERFGATANLDSSYARRLCNTAGRDEETGFQVEQRNRSRKQDHRSETA